MQNLVTKHIYHSQSYSKPRKMLSKYFFLSLLFENDLEDCGAKVLGGKFKMAGLTWHAHVIIRRSTIQQFERQEATNIYPFSWILWESNHRTGICKGSHCHACSIACLYLFLTLQLKRPRVSASTKWFKHLLASITTSWGVSLEMFVKVFWASGFGCSKDETTSGSLTMAHCIQNGRGRVLGHTKICCIWTVPSQSQTSLPHRWF